MKKNNMETPKVPEEENTLSAEEVLTGDRDQPAEEIPAEEISAEGGDQPVKEDSAEEISAEGGEQPAEEAPAEDSAQPAEEIPAEDGVQPAEETPAEGGDQHAEDTSAEAAPAEENTQPAEAAPSEAKKPEEKNTDLNKKGNRGVKALIIALVIVVALGTAATVAYFVGRDYFREHFMFHTTVNGQDVSKVEMNQIMASIKEKYPTTFVIHEKDDVEESIDFSKTITNDDIDRFIESQKADAVYWYRSFFNETNFTSSDKIEIKEDDFKALVKDALNSVKRSASKDAYIDNDKMEIVPEKIGNELDVDAICEKAYKAADENVYEVTVDKDEYIMPKVYKDDDSLTSVIDEYKRRIDRTIPVYVMSKISKEISPETLKEWISYDGEKFNVDKDSVFEYTEQLEYAYNTAYSDREFTTSYGSTIHVGRGANDSYAGWLMDEDETYANILAAVDSDSEAEAEVVWTLVGYTLDEKGDDIGGTYIEISIENQHMWYYQNGKLTLDTDVVTGLENDPNRRTPRGLFYLLEMASPYVMHGDYGQQPCDYFIKVTWDGVAIHDAPWQPTFGGTQYIYSGSHGCINTPYSKVSALWDYLTALDDWQVPVIIY